MDWFDIYLITRLPVIGEGAVIIIVFGFISMIATGIGFTVSTLDENQDAAIAKATGEE